MIIINLIILSILIIKSTVSSPILDEKMRSNNDNWLTRTKLSNDESLSKKYLASKLIPQSFSKTSSLGKLRGDAVKLLDPNYRKAINQLIMEINKQKSVSISTNPKNVQSLYSSCDDIDLESDVEDNKLIKSNKLLPLYFNLEKSSFNKPMNTIIKSQLRIYLKQKSIDNCDCKSNLNEHNQLHLSLYDASTSNKIAFLPFKEVNKKSQHIQTVKLNRCCDHLITFDLTELVKKWKMYPQLNNGLLLELKDNLGNKLNINDFIHTMNCSDKNPPLPFIKLIYPDLPTLIKEAELQYPTLDVAYRSDNSDLFSNRNNRNSEQHNFDDDRIDKDANV